MVPARGPLTGIVYKTAGTGNQNFGYVGGGLPSSAGRKTVVDRIDYSNDTATATERGPLTFQTFFPQQQVMPTLVTLVVDGIRVV